MDVVKQLDVAALRRLQIAKNRLTAQQYKTLRGQVLAGNADGAMRGLQKILERTTHKCD